MSLYLVIGLLREGPALNDSMVSVYLDTKRGYVPLWVSQYDREGHFQERLSTDKTKTFQGKLIILSLQLCLPEFWLSDLKPQLKERGKEKQHSDALVTLRNRGVCKVHTV